MKRFWVGIFSPSYFIARRAESLRESPVLIIRFQKHSTVHDWISMLTLIEFLHDRMYYLMRRNERKNFNYDPTNAFVSDIVLRGSAERVFKKIGRCRAQSRLEQGQGRLYRQLCCVSQPGSVQGRLHRPCLKRFVKRTGRISGSSEQLPSKL